MNAALLAVFGIAVYFRWADVARMTLNEWGDFIAGAFAPMALLWVVVGYLQHGQELRLNTNALRQQQQELQRQADETKRQANETNRLASATDRQTRATERQTREQARAAERQLRETRFRRR